MGVNREAIFRAVLALVAGLLASIRLYYGRRSRQRGGRVMIQRTSAGATTLLWILGATAALASALYVLKPRSIGWASLSIPSWMRWIGVGLGGITVLLFAWVHRALGANWAMPGEIRERQVLVMVGPYRWVRHPMYTTIFVWAAAFLLITANWLIGGAWFSLGVVAAALTDQEEATLLARFGETYRAYQQRTGRFLPRA